MTPAETSLLGAQGAATRWELYRLLADPVRPRLLALASVEELAVGELADLLREGQPKISRHAAALREAGLLGARRQGTWTLLRLAPDAAKDPVVADAVNAGRLSCEADGTLARVDGVLAARDAETREFFARGGRPGRTGPPEELGAYLVAIGRLIAHRKLAVDVGTGDGALLEVLSPLFERVVAIDRSDEQIKLASERVRRRELRNVELVCGEINGRAVRDAVVKRGGADVVFASRVLHHAPLPQKAMHDIADLARAPHGASPGGAIFVLDYETHEDQALRAQEADLWLGFEPRDLRKYAEEAGIEGLSVTRLPGAWRGEGPDRHLIWQLLAGHRGKNIRKPTKHREKSS